MAKPILILQISLLRMICDFYNAAATIKLLNKSEVTYLQCNIFNDCVGRTLGLTNDSRKNNYPGVVGSCEL